MRSYIPASLCLLLLWLLAGCGGGGTTPHVASAGGPGRATMTVTWPARTRLIPAAANSIVVVINQGTTVVTQQSLPRPASGGTSTVSFTALPAGTLSVKATAYPTAAGTGVAQATATAPLSIVAGQNTAFSLTMNSTINHIDLSAVTSTVFVTGTLPITATAKDSTGAIVLTSATKLTWASDKTTVASVDSNGNVTGVAVGTANISVTDTESGKSATTSVTVKPIPTISFLTPVTYPVNGPNEIVTADFDGDGKIDIAVGTSTGLVILYGNGDGTFGAAQTVLTWSGGTSPFSAADMNGDGKPDLVCTASNQILVLTNLGGRNFAAPIAIPCGASIGMLVTGDFNKDGRPDIAAAVYDHPGSTETDIFTFQNQGGGVFVKGPTITNIWIIQGLKTADLNGDGNLDLLVSITTDEVGASGSSIYFGDGAGNFTGGGGTGTASFNVNQTAIGDFNGDGKLDYAIANDTDGGVSVILNTGNGTFGTPATYGGFAYPDHMSAVDMDGDGRPDLVVENRNATYFSVLRDQNGLFPIQLQFPCGVNSGPLAVADLNGDGRPDVITSNTGGNSIAVILNSTH